MLDQAYAGPKKVAEREDSRGPRSSAEDVEEVELSLWHAARAGDERPEDPQAHNGHAVLVAAVEAPSTQLDL